MFKLLRNILFYKHQADGRNKLLMIPLIMLLVAITQGCDLYPQDDYQEFYVVEAYLVANQELPQIRLSKTLPVNVEYSFEEAAVSDANVTVQLLDEQGNAETEVPYQLQSRGVFTPEVNLTVEPERWYELEITFPNGDAPLRSQTLVPGTFETVEVASDSVVYQSEDQITITTTRSSYPGRQSYFVFSVRSEEPTEEKLTPFYLDIFNEGDEELSEYAINSSGIINEGNYEQNSDNTLTLRVPWLAIAFYEENEIIANAIDDNLYDFLRSQEVQTGDGPSTLPPGEIQNVIYNVEGGIGIFGSMAMTSNRVFVRRAAQNLE